MYTGIVVEILKWINGDYHAVDGTPMDRILGIDCRMANMNNLNSKQFDYATEFLVPEIFLARAIGCYAGLFIRVSSKETEAEKMYDTILWHAGYCVVCVADSKTGIKKCCQYLNGNL